MLLTQSTLRRFTACLLALALLLSPALVSAYGGGGSEGTGGFNNMVAKRDPWKPSELAGIFGSLKPAEQDTLITAFTGSTINKRDLLSVRQVFLERESDKLNRDADMLDAMVKALEVLDKTGQYAQDGLSFVPGVGWVTAAALGAARGGANAYRDGKSGATIAKEIVIGGGASGLVGKFSPLNADKAFSTARAGINVARNAISQQIKNKALKIAAKNAAVFTGKKGIEFMGEKAIAAGMQKIADRAGAKNFAQVPSYTPTPGFAPGTPSIDPNMSAPATPVSGGTPQL